MSEWGSTFGFCNKNELLVIARCTMGTGPVVQQKNAKLFLLGPSTLAKRMERSTSEHTLGLAVCDIIRGKVYVLNSAKANRGT